MARLFDGVDEDRAMKLRIHFGQRRWVVSWEPREDGTWLARISSPGVSRTIVRHGRTRVEAIDRAARTLQQAVNLRLRRGQEV